MSLLRQKAESKRKLLDYPKALIRRGRLTLIRLSRRSEERFVCPLCNYRGPFVEIIRTTLIRRFAQCPNCGALERHRIQVLVMEKLSQSVDFSKLAMLHVAPEQCLLRLLRPAFGSYTTADPSMEGVDVKIDLTEMPFKDAQFDVVYASHVLQHIQDDATALSEMRRVLRPGGFAVLPVPIVSERTVEYFRPNPAEENQVRAPGPDYYAKYSRFFTRIEKYSSYDFPAEHQTFIYQRKFARQNTGEPAKETVNEKKLVDMVPVCFA